MKIFKLCTVAFFAVFILSCASNPIPEPDPAEIAAAKPYPLDYCLVIERPLKESKKTYTKIYKGQVVKFCCKGCIKAFEANPDLFMVKVQ